MQTKLRFAYLTLVFFGCILQAIPKFFYDQLLVGGFPIYTYVIAIAVILALPVIGRQILYRNLSVILLSVLMTWGGVLAILYSYDSLFRINNFAYDFLVVAGLCASIAVGIETGYKKLQNYMVVLQIVMIVMLILSIYLLRTGGITSAIEGQREFDISMFFTAALCTWLLPVATVTLLRTKLPILALANLVIVAITELAFIEMSATRNVLLVLILSIVFSVIVYVREKDAPWKSLSIALVVIAVFVPLISSDYSDIYNWLRLENLRQRIGSESFQSFDRVEEAELMFKQHGLNLVFGLGLGGTFISNVVTVSSPDGLANTLHIGILTPVLKFGILGFALMVIIPLFKAIKTAFGRFGLNSFGFAASIIVYFTQACISGGYHYSVAVVIGLLFCPLINSYAKDYKKHVFIQNFRRSER